MDEDAFAAQAIDCALDYVCLRPLNPVEMHTKGVLYLEVCLRCGLQYRGTLQENIDYRHDHICNPDKREERTPIPGWALAGRKRDRSHR